MPSSTIRQRTLERRTKRRRQSQIRLIIGISVSAVVLAVFLILLSGRPNIEVTEADYNGLTQDIDRSFATGAVGYAIGDPQAPITLVEYSDFSCGHCYDLSDIIHQLINKYVRSGDLRIIYKPISFVRESSVPAAKAAYCAGEQGKFWEMHDAIWSIYPQSLQGGYPRNRLFSRAERVGLDMNTFSICYDAPDTVAAIQAVVDEAYSLGIEGTPIVFLDNEQVGYTGNDTFYDVLSAAIDARLSR